MKDNIIQQKSYKFAIEIIELYKYLVGTKKEFVLSKQLLRSGTSIGANIEEAVGGQSKKDFISKISIAYKEARETKYWLEVIAKANKESRDFARKLWQEGHELTLIFSKILLTLEGRKSVK